MSGTPVVPGDADPGAPRLRRRGRRTALLIAGAALLGVVAGACAGYLIQADREPTALPSLSQPELARAGGPGPEPLPASLDRRLKTEGDLRKLLLKKPRGAKDSAWSARSDGWLDAADYAEEFQQPAAEFGKLIGDEFRRAAVTGWRSGYQAVEIRLVQFRQEENPAAFDSVEDHQFWAENKDDVDSSRPVPGTGSGMAYSHTRPRTRVGSVSLYVAEAHAVRGDVAMEIWIYDTRPIPKAKILDLAERQMERL
ncbi:hypothetical protein [Streptomyces sp. H51]|uniref:hypothetical protein n=1 Tax=Streptomyces sp. H51 TaxID=3111770 RepID=UPI002D77FD13|nr:hypothetical protein [Streptomyces sp. H51]